LANQVFSPRVVLTFRVYTVSSAGSAAGSAASLGSVVSAVPGVEEGAESFLPASFLLQPVNVPKMKTIDKAQINATTRFIIPFPPNSIKCVLRAFCYF
jgi:hypothetical protein